MRLLHEVSPWWALCRVLLFIPWYRSSWPYFFNRVLFRLGVDAYRGATQLSLVSQPIELAGQSPAEPPVRHKSDWRGTTIDEPSYVTIVNMYSFYSIGVARTDVALRVLLMLLGWNVFVCCSRFDVFTWFSRSKPLRSWALWSISLFINAWLYNSCHVWHKFYTQF